MSRFFLFFSNEITLKFQAENVPFLSLFLSQDYFEISCLNYLLISFSLTNELNDVKHLKEQYKGWQRTLRTKLKKARQTGAGAQDDHDEGEELLYQILRKNGSVAAAVKVGKLLQKLIYEREK